MIEPVGDLNYYISDVPITEWLVEVHRLEEHALILSMLVTFETFQHASGSLKSLCRVKAKVISLTSDTSQHPISLP